MKIREILGDRMPLKERRVIYNRRYKEKNIDKIREHDRFYQKKFRKENPEIKKEFDRKRHHKLRNKRALYSKKHYEKVKDTKEYKDYRKLISKRYYVNNQLKVSARLKFSKALLRGKINRPSFCSGCLNTDKVEGHHDDYLKPLEVIWLCKNCHRIYENIKWEINNGMPKLQA